MMTRSRAGLATLGMGAMVWLTATPARALEGDWSALRAQVEADRKTHGATHKAVAAVLARVTARPPTFERRAQVSRQLRALGRDALFPTLALLSYDDGKLAALPPHARVPMTAGLLEALRDIKDPRALPVLRAVLDGPESDATVAQSAAEATGALCDAAGISFLGGHAVNGDRREMAALHGLGWCRSEGSARILLGRLADGSADATLTASAQALGWWGSSWAWATLDKAAQERGKATRLEVVHALVTTYLAHKGEVRLETGRSLLMLEHPETSALLREASRGADEATAQDVARLLARMRSTH